MTMPNNNKKNPGDRLRSIISAAGQKKEDLSETQKSPIGNLPRLRPADQPVNAENPAPPSEPQANPVDKRERRLRALWTIGSAVSLISNAILIGVLFLVLQAAGGLNATGLGTGLLGGLYSNFERMDAATIKTNIPVNDNIALDLNIPVQTTTSITLAQDVLIQNAHVKISTSTFNIDSNADVTLPAGTPLNVVLNFMLPIQQTVPVSLNVPVKIPLKDTELHPAIAGLESTIQPLYCIVNPSALSITGSAICPLH